MSLGQGLTGARATGFGHGVNGRTRAAPSARRAAPDEDERGTGVAGWGRRQKGSGGRERLTGADPSARGGRGGAAVAAVATWRAWGHGGRRVGHTAARATAGEHGGS